jgi:Protein of unknown function (DUF3631)
MPKHQVEPDIPIIEEEDGAALLAEVEAAIRRYVVLPTQEAYVALTLWVAATHGIEVWDHAPRAVFVSPEMRCGKTRALEVAGEMSLDQLDVATVSVAALYRTVAGQYRTIMHDEADTVFSAKASDAAKEELRGFYNAGFNRNKKAVRCVDGGRHVAEFSTFAMAAFTSIGDLPDTIMDRSVVFRMRRREPDEQVWSFRERDRPALGAIRSRLTAWVEGCTDKLEVADPATPLEDRAADVWAPLLAIADEAGGEWPDRARAAAVASVEAERGMARETLNQQLLADIRRLWPEGQDRVQSEQLVQFLNLDMESGWRNFNGRSGLDPTTVSNLLRQYELRPRPHKFGDKAKRGYLRSEFEAVWRRYLAPEVTTDPP